MNSEGIPSPNCYSSQKLVLLAFTRLSGVLTSTPKQTIPRYQEIRHEGEYTMQLKDQKSELSSIENVSNPADLAEENLDGQIISKPSFPIAEQVEPPVSFPKKKFMKLGILIRLSIVFFVGLGGIMLASPSFLDCSSKARQSEGRNNIGAIGRGQQAFYLENNKFANSIPELAIGISPETNNYKYFVQADRQFVVSYAQGKTPNTKSYLGVAFVGIVTNSDKAPTTQSITCEVDKPQPLASIMPTYKNGRISCPQGTKLLGY